MADLTKDADADLIHLYHRDRAPGLHTRSACEIPCGNSARGGGPCEGCCRAGLVRRHGAVAADAMLEGG